MMLSAEKMADIREHSLNKQERDVIETLDAQIVELRDALRWAIPRIDATRLRMEGGGRYPNSFDRVHKLAYD